jgi:hypothetical protein
VYDRTRPAWELFGPSCPPRLGWGDRWHHHTCWSSFGNMGSVPFLGGV